MYRSYSYHLLVNISNKINLVLFQAPGMKYAKGYNADMGDTGMWHDLIFFEVLEVYHILKKLFSVVLFSGFLFKQKLNKEDSIVWALNRPFLLYCNVNKRNWKTLGQFFFLKWFVEDRMENVWYFLDETIKFTEDPETLRMERKILRHFVHCR